MSDKTNLTIDPHLKVRLEALASKLNLSIDDIAHDVLRAHADDLEQSLSEFAEDDERWQRYIETGHSVSYQTIRKKLRILAGKAAERANTQ